MAKNDNAHAIRLSESLHKQGKHTEAAAFAESNPLSKAATAEKKFEWAQRQCVFLREHFDEETIKAIRRDCACGPELGKAKKLKAVYEREQDLYAFAEKANRLRQGFVLEYDGEYLYLLYPQCYCSCVKRMEAALPEEWCYCTLGYAKRLFGYIFDREIEAELISSIKQGAEVCRIRLLPQGNGNEE